MPLVLVGVAVELGFQVGEGLIDGRIEVFFEAFGQKHLLFDRGGDTDMRLTVFVDFHGHTDARYLQRRIMREERFDLFGRRLPDQFRDFKVPPVDDDLHTLPPSERCRGGMPHR
ncbi:hypothetical protein SDC9_114403 [bioreactor metagenome]|uniref:Uncharacterized protein n=1 Tax=bioreactor metagenome TaxID=1076179 RepID=A0A645BPV6_9ZZZZ